MNDSPSVDRDVLLVSWNGREPPLARLLADVQPRFELLLFDYSGQARLACAPLGATLMSERTECKGDLYNALARRLSERGQRPRFVGLIDDDVVLSVSDIHRLMHLGACHGLHAYSAALGHDSHYTHRWTLKQTNRVLRSVDWVEVMMPFYSGRLFLEAAPHFASNVSSWGIDRYLMPTLQRLRGLEGCCIVDAVMASHVRPVTSGQSVFRNGLTAAEEAAQLKAHCLALIDAEQPALRGSDWFHRLFERRHTRSRWEQIGSAIGRPIRRWLERST
jgi:hypothetical protein